MLSWISCLKWRLNPKSKTKGTFNSQVISWSSRTFAFFFCSYCHNLNSQAPDCMSTDILFSNLEFLNLLSLKLQSSDFAGSGICSDFGAVWKEGDNFKWRKKIFFSSSGWSKRLHQYLTSSASLNHSMIWIFKFQSTLSQIHSLYHVISMIGCQLRVRHYLFSFF